MESFQGEFWIWKGRARIESSRSVIYLQSESERLPKDDNDYDEL